MNYFKNLCSSMIIATALISTSYASKDVNVDFKGNWTKSFVILDGSKVEHTPTYVSFGFIRGGTGIKMTTASYNGIKLKAPIDLKTDSTVEEFIAALKASGLIK